MNKPIFSLLFISSLCFPSNNQRLASSPSAEDQRIVQIIRDYNKSERKKNKKDYATMKTLGISFATALVTSLAGSFVMLRFSNQ